MVAGRDRDIVVPVQVLDGSSVSFLVTTGFMCSLDLGGEQDRYLLRPFQLSNKKKDTGDGRYHTLVPGLQE